MRLNKTYNRMNIGEKTFRHRVTIEDIHPTETNSYEARTSLVKIFTALVDTPDLLTCGDKTMFDSMSIKHNGMRWVIEMEAITNEENR